MPFSRDGLEALRSSLREFLSLARLPRIDSSGKLLARCLALFTR